MAIANQNPINVINYPVNFTTTNLSNGNTFVEPHTVAGPIPSGTFNIPLNGINLAGSKVVVPLQTTTGAGSYWLKFWLPQPGSSVMYITFSIKTNGVADGYYDYQTGIPADFRTALRTWIKDNVSTPISSTVTLQKNLLFTVYGLDTNQVSSAIQFKARFSAIFSNSATTTPVARTS
jgi:hypothetical protein